MMYDALIFGKANIPGIVNIEVDGDKAFLFVQDKEGTIETKLVPNKYWILSETQIDKSWVRLTGELHYKWGKQYSTREDFQKYRGIYGKRYDTTTVWSAQEALMIKDGYTYYQGLQPKDISLMSIDIETTGLNAFANDAKLLAVSTTFRNSKQELIKKSFYYDEYQTQKKMLLSLQDHIIKLNPSLIIGHNIISFDIPYMSGIAEQEGITLNWGRDNSEIKFESRESNFRLDGTRNLHYKNCTIFGREIVDTYFLSIKYDVSKSMESYGLKPMIKQLGMEAPNRTFYDASLIRENYKIPSEWALIKAYCVDDADDAIKLWDLMGPLFFFTCQMVPKPFNKVILGASGSQINSMMMRAYLQDRHSLPKTTEIKSFEGALSWGQPGIYNNVMKVDVASLYPSIILQYEVYDKEKDPKAYLLTLVKKFRANRLEYKRLAAETGLQSYKDMDTAAKGILNSFYGFFAASGLSFNSMACAEFITAKGREILEKAIVWATGKEFRDIAPDYYAQKESDVTDLEEE